MMGVQIDTCTLKPHRQPKVKHAHGTLVFRHESCYRRDVNLHLHTRARMGNIPIVAVVDPRRLVMLLEEMKFAK